MVALTAQKSQESVVRHATGEPLESSGIPTSPSLIEAARLGQQRGGPGFIPSTSLALTPEEVRLLSLPKDPRAQWAAMNANKVDVQLAGIPGAGSQGNNSLSQYSVQPEGVKGLEQVKLSSLDKQFKALDAAIRTTDPEKIKAAYKELKEGLYGLGKKVGLPSEALDFILDEALSFKRLGDPKIQLKAFLENPGQLSGEALAFACMDATFLVDALKTELHKYYHLTPLGPVSQPVLTQLLIPYTDPKIEGSNVCGPQALYYLLAGGGAFSYAGGLGLSEEQAAAVGKILKDKTNPGIFGTDPGDLRTAVEAATDNKFTLTEHRFESPQEVIDFAVKHVPCLLKFGSGLLSQHYDTIMEVRDAPSGRVFLTSSGLAIPEKHLLEMVGQKPYANHAWELKQKNP
jgi:hypothetical protein